MGTRFQSYRGTWAWLVQRISAIVLFLLIPLKIYSGWGARGQVPFPNSLLPSTVVHFNAAIDILLLLCFLLHGLYGVRVILIDLGWLREDRFFWRTLAAALLIFGLTIWFVYLHPRGTPQQKYSNIQGLPRTLVNRASFAIQTSTRAAPGFEV
jgi:succinate dehydrogenase/fumarate reductase cytochrome b subunit